MMNPETQSQQRMDKVRQLYYTVSPEIEESVYSPYFYAEVRIDFNDVRTGLHEPLSLHKAMELYSPNADLLWIKDMVHDVDPRKITPSAPDDVHLNALPDYVNANFISRMETQFIQYLLRSFVTGIYRNSALNLYSSSGESREEFAGRCLDLIGEPMRRDLDLLHDVFKRRLEQLREKYLVSNESNGLEQARFDSQNRDIFSHYSDRIAELFLRGRFGSRQSMALFRESPGMQELEERLAALGFEAQNAITKLTSSYEEKACALDEYILHPNLKDIHFVRSCILWMPQKAA
jgi:hypothetical protein